MFPLEPVRLGAVALGRARSLCSTGSLRRLIRENLAFDLLEDAAIPVHVVATDVGSGEEVLLSEGDPVDAILASAAIPAVFPAVRIADRDLIDGGIADNAAVSQAVDPRCGHRVRATDGLRLCAGGAAGDAPREPRFMPSRCSSSNA